MVLTKKMPRGLCGALRQAFFSVRFVSVSVVSTRFVPFRFVPFRFVSIPFVSFCCGSFRFVSCGIVSFFSVLGGTIKEPMLPVLYWFGRNYLLRRVSIRAVRGTRGRGATGRGVGAWGRGNVLTGRVIRFLPGVGVK